MQIDMHFYGTYAVARIAGFSPDLAKTVATAAQFVDEAVSATPINLGGRSYQLPVVSSHKLSEISKNFDQMDQWNVWVPFHFLPGGEGGGADEHLICLWGEPGNKAVDDIIELALEAGASRKRYALHLLGIVSHVIQDTYAHYGFSGMSSDLNEVDQSTLNPIDVKEVGNYIQGKLNKFWERVGASFAEATKLGHAGVATFPDRPYLKWEFEYESTLGIDIDYLQEPHDNRTTFFMACTRLHAVFTAFLNGQTSIEAEGGHLSFADDVAAEIQAIIDEEGTKEQRSQFWRGRINADALFGASSEDFDLQYNDTGWEVGIMEDNSLAASTEAYQYNRAAYKYLSKVHNEILPGMGILVG